MVDVRCWMLDAGLFEVAIRPTPHLSVAEGGRSKVVCDDT